MPNAQLASIFSFCACVNALIDVQPLIMQGSSYNYLARISTDKTTQSFYHSALSATSITRQRVWVSLWKSAEVAQLPMVGGCEKRVAS
jgi:hypothetical protein